MLAALATSSAFAASTINRTGSFDAQDVADIAMGQADVLARTGDGVVVDDIVIPTASGAAAVTHVIQDLDLTVTLVGPGGTETVTGRLLPYSDPITEGMFVRGPRVVRLSSLTISGFQFSSFGLVRCPSQSRRSTHGNKPESIVPAWWWEAGEEASEGVGAVAEVRGVHRDVDVLGHAA